MSSHAELLAKAAATYNSAADSYDASANTFWERFGRSTISRLKLSPGMHVIDVCAGTGASAIPAAEAVGSQGRVVAVDVADALLALLNRKADALGLRQIEVRSQDLLALDPAREQFDAGRLWSLVRPGGRMAITTWGPNAFEPGNSAFWTAVRRERPELDRGFAPWDLITEPEALRRLLLDAGVPAPAIEFEPAMHPLASPQAWWALVMGSGYRATIDQLDEEGRERVRTANLEFVAQNGIAAIEANVLYALARKPHDWHAGNQGQ